ncbi:MAG: hypothetical protein E7670_05240 [Ruminococcaceae bacterium]|nr:hypothetical protein [Oscillospiraceae bacterium]
MTIRNTNTRGIRPELIKRVIIYGILILLISSAQCSFFAGLKICPATPDLVIGIVLAVSLLDSIRSAAAVGIAAGFVTDALGSTGSFSFSALFYLVCAVILGSIACKMLPRFLSFLCLLIPALALRAVYTTLCVCLKLHSVPPLSILASLVLPEIIVTAVLCIPLYPIVKLCVIPVKSRSRFSF